LIRWHCRVPQVRFSKGYFIIQIRSYISNKRPQKRGYVLNMVISLGPTVPANGNREREKERREGSVITQKYKQHEINETV